MTGLASAVSCAVALLAAVVLRRRPSSPVVPALAAVMAAGVWWTGMAAASVVLDGVAREIAVGLATAGTGAVAMATLWSSLVLSGHAAVLTPRTRALLVAEPVVVAAAVLVPSTRQLVVRDLTVVDGALRLEPGPILLLHALVAFGAVVLSALLHVAVARSALPAHRHLHRVALLVMAVPTAGIAVTLARAGTSLHDYGAATFVVPAAAWLWVERCTARLGTVPITTEQVLDALPDVVVVTDPDGRVVSANGAALELLHRRRPGRAVVGARWVDLVGPELVRRLQPIDHETVTTSSGATIDVRVTRLHHQDGTLQGTVAVVRDVTEVERLRSELAELAVRDGLTGLHNRRHLDGVARELVAAAHRTGSPLSAVMVDIDHFKAVNDTHGHAVGDEVLVALSRELARCMGRDDVLVRFGGEEFLALVPGACPGTLAPRVESCRRRIRAMRWPTASGELGLTVSVGIAGLAPGGDVDTLLVAADQELYRAKAEGRDRVAVGT